jgi:signal transduction histidine kinase
VAKYLQEQARTDPLEELRRHNGELFETLESLRARQEDLQRANLELEDTNRGVMAMFQELSAELEQTNIGVVALYAELERTNDELRRADDARLRLYSSVGHELKTPINAIASLSALLAREADGPLSQEQRHQVELIASAAQSLGSVVGDLLDLARAQSHRVELRLEPCDVVEILASLVALLRPLANPGVVLRLDTSVAPLTIWTDKEKLTQIVRNLLSNALKFTTSGEIVVVPRVEGDLLELVVRDTGVGIPPAEQERIFDEFVQVPGPHQIGHRGSGLGLALVRQLTELLGGTVGVESEVGRGAQFCVTIPVRGGAGARPRVLLVDDDVAFRYVARRLLERCGAEVFEATDGTSGLAAMRREEPDLVLLDLHLPDMSGESILDLRATEPDLRVIPVAVVSGQPGAVDGRDDLVGVVEKSAMDESSMRALLATVGARGARVEGSG